MKKQKNEKNKLKKLKAKRIIYNVVISLVIIVFSILLKIVPDGLMVYTGRYGTGNEEENAFINKVMGPNAEDNYKLYFYWYNVVHESGHGLMMFNGNKKQTYAENEMLVNKFAVAYWRRFGEEEKIIKLEQIVDYALSQLNNPAKNGQSIVEWFNENYENQMKNQSFNDYGYFQFASVKEALESDKSLEDIVYEMTDKRVTITDKLLTYNSIDEESSTQVIMDASDNYREWGLNYPEHDMIVHNYINQPNNHYSTTLKNVYDAIMPKVIVILIIQMAIVNFIYYKKIKKLSQGV